MVSHISVLTAFYCCCCTGSLLHLAFFSCSARASHCGAQASLVVVCRLTCPVACGILVPRPGIKSMSTALESGFSFFLIILRIYFNFWLYWVFIVTKDVL